MEQTVRVRQLLPDGRAVVSHTRLSACSGDCHKCSGCGAAKETMLLTAENPIGAGLGDLVKIQSESAPVLKAAAVLYVLPLVLFFLGYGLGAAAGSWGPWGGGIGFAAGIAIVIFYDRQIAKREKTIYTITGYAPEPGGRT